MLGYVTEIIIRLFIEKAVINLNLGIKMRDLLKLDSGTHLKHYDAYIKEQVGIYHKEPTKAYILDYPLGFNDFICKFRLKLELKDILTRMNSDDLKELCDHIEQEYKSDEPPVHWLCYIRMLEFILKNNTDMDQDLEDRIKKIKNDILFACYKKFLQPIPDLKNIIPEQIIKQIVLNVKTLENIEKAQKKKKALLYNKVLQLGNLGVYYIEAILQAEVEDLRFSPEQTVLYATLCKNLTSVTVEECIEICQGAVIKKFICKKVDELRKVLSREKLQELKNIVDSQVASQKPYSLPELDVIGNLEFNVAGFSNFVNYLLHDDMNHNDFLALEEEQTMAISQTADGYNVAESDKKLDLPHNDAELPEQDCQIDIQESKYDMNGLPSGGYIKQNDPPALEEEETQGSFASSDKSSYDMNGLPLGDYIKQNDPPALEEEQTMAISQTADGYNVAESDKKLDLPHNNAELPEQDCQIDIQESKYDMNGLPLGGYIKQNDPPALEEEETQGSFASSDKSSYDMNGLPLGDYIKQNDPPALEEEETQGSLARYTKYIKEQVGIYHKEPTKAYILDYPLGFNDFICKFRLKLELKDILTRMNSDDLKELCDHIEQEYKSDEPPVHWLCYIRMLEFILKNNTDMDQDLEDRIKKIKNDILFACYKKFLQPIPDLKNIIPEQIIKQIVLNVKTLENIEKAQKKKKALLYNKVLQLGNLGVYYIEAILQAEVEDLRFSPEQTVLYATLCKNLTSVTLEKCIEICQGAVIIKSICDKANELSKVLSREKLQELKNIVDSQVASQKPYSLPELDVIGNLDNIAGCSNFVNYLLHDDMNHNDFLALEEEQTMAISQTADGYNVAESDKKLDLPHNDAELPEQNLQVKNPVLQQESSERSHKFKRRHNETEDKKRLKRTQNCKDYLSKMDVIISRM